MTNFTNTNKTKGVSMNREQKASRTSMPNTGLAAKLSNLSRIQGTGLPSSRALLVAVGCVAVAMGMLATAAPALAKSPTVKTPVVSDVSYTSVDVTGKVTTDGSGNFTNTAYAFEYCADGLDCTENVNWTIGFQSGFGTNIVGPATNKEVEAPITGLNDGTKYFIRLAASNGTAIGSPPEVVSPEPNPSFTTLTADPTAVVTVDNASEVAYTTAKATGKIKRPEHSDDVACHFEYITDAAFNKNLGDSVPGFQGATPVGCEPEESVATIGNEVPVSAKLKDLANNTKYHLRLAVSNAANSDAKEAAQTFTTLTVGPPSVVSVENAGEVEYTQAQVKGIVERPDTVPDPGVDVSCNFEYVTQTQFEEEEFAAAGLNGQLVACEPEAHPTENPITATGPTPVKATLGGLVPFTTYHLRLSATNQGGSDAKDAASTFATEGPIPSPKVISIEDASEISYRTAKAEGVVERPAGKDPALDTSCRFEYITDAQFKENEEDLSQPGFTGATPLACAETLLAGPTPVTAQLTELKSGATYHLRLVAEDSAGPVVKDANTFTTVPGGDPTAAVDTAPPVVGYTTLKVFGTAAYGLGAEDELLRYNFEVAEVGTENWINGCCGNEQVVPHTPEQLSWEFTGLTPNTEYKYRIFLERSNRSTSDGALSPESSATTKPLPAPTVTIDPVTDITGTGAHFSGTVDTNAPAGPLDDLAKAAYRTRWHFECTPTCPGNQLSGTIEGEEGSKAVSVDATRLLANTPGYEVKLVAHNEVYGAETPPQTFDAPLVKPTVTALPGGSDGEGGYTIAGTVDPNNSPVTACEFRWGPNSASYAFEADCSPVPPINGAKPVTVEAHLTGLNPGSVYHVKLFATNEAGTEESKPDREFTPTLGAKGPACPNEQLRAENGSLGLPECRAYEMTTYPNKEGASAQFNDFDGGDALLYSSTAVNLANSGIGRFGFPSPYVAIRTPTGWETISDLNGPTGSLNSAPEVLKEAIPTLYSSDLLSSIWGVQTGDEPNPIVSRRAPDGSFSRVGKLAPDASFAVASKVRAATGGASDDLSHVVFNGGEFGYSTLWGPGVYEFVGTGNDLPRRVDLDNSGEPISSCLPGGVGAFTSLENAVSSDGRVIVVSVQDTCGGDNPPAGEVWARVGGTTSYDVSGSRCNRTAPADPCNAPAASTFQGAAKDGSRVYFTTKQQLVDGDTDETRDLYACDIPPGTPTPSAEPANPCAPLHEVSAGSAGKADVQKVLSVSDDGSTAYFTAKGVLAGNEDALKEKALPGDENLYVWRTDAAHPDGQIAFVARLPENNPGVAQTTPDGRYLALQTAGQLLSTDTDEASDIYRYDAATEELARVSTAVSGAGGNGPFDAKLSPAAGNIPRHNSHLSISDDGELIVFTTEEALSPLDGNGEPDAYLWNDGHVLGSVAPLPPGSDSNAGQSLPGNVFIDGSGQDIYVQTGARLTASDIDTSLDIYDARIDGGFPQHQEGCSGETCEPPASNPPAIPASPANRPNGEGNVVPKHCRKGKILKGNKCVKKSHGKHHKKKGKGHAKRASHNRGDSK